jgi:hypothetical protein
MASYDTFERVFARLDPKAFKKYFAAWIQAISELTKGAL